jgi:hypothetical protein
MTNHGPVFLGPFLFVVVAALVPPKTAEITKT